MTVEAIAGLDLISPKDAPTSLTTSAPAGFAERLRSELAATNSQLVNAESELQDLAAGRQSNLHHVMLTMEEARQSFQLLVQVRNKLLDAYQELMRMQV